MTLAVAMLADDALRASDEGLELDIHLNWYRSLPLSSVRTVELTIDGETIPPEEIVFVLGGKEYALDDLSRHWDETWFVLDAATLRVPGRTVDRGQQVEVTLRRGNRIPYILIGPGLPLEHVSERSTTLVAR